MIKYLKFVLKSNSTNLGDAGLRVLVTVGGAFGTVCLQVVQVIVTDFGCSLLNDFLWWRFYYLDRFLVPTARSVCLSRTWAVTMTTVTLWATITTRVLARIASTHPIMSSRTRTTSVQQMFTSTSHNPHPRRYRWNNSIIISVLILNLTLLIILLSRNSLYCDLSWRYFMNSDIPAYFIWVNLSFVFICYSAVGIVWRYATATTSWCVHVYARLQAIGHSLSLTDVYFALRALRSSDLWWWGHFRWRLYLCLTCWVSCFLFLSLSSYWSHLNTLKAKTDELTLLSFHYSLNFLCHRADLLQHF